MTVILITTTKSELKSVPEPKPEPKPNMNNIEEKASGQCNCGCYADDSMDTRCCGLCYCGLCNCCFLARKNPPSKEECDFCMRDLWEHSKSGYIQTITGYGRGEESDCCCTCLCLPLKFPLFFPCFLGALFNHFMNACCATSCCARTCGHCKLFGGCGTPMLRNYLF